MTTMTSDRFKEIQQQMNLKNQEMADLLNTSIRNVENWRSGRKRITGPTDKLVRVLFKLKSRENVSEDFFNEVCE